MGDATVGNNRTALVAEMLGYAGGALAVGAVFAVMATYGEALGLFGRTGIMGVVALAFIWGGALATRSSSRSARRLGDYLLLLGIIAVGLLAAIAADGLLPRDTLGYVQGNNSALPAVIGTGVSLVAAFLVWRKRESLQIALALALGAFVLSALFEFAREGAFSLVGLVFASLGLIWMMLAERGIMRPLNSSWAMGCLALGFGLYAEVLRTGAEQSERLSETLWFCIASAALLLLVGARLHRFVAVGFGSIGMLISVATFLTTAPSGSSLPLIALAALGVLLVGASIWLISAEKRKSEGRPQWDRPPAST